MTPDIHELDARTVDRIAAGEVVERPASAVKELVENSLDADASRVEIAVEAGGTERIEVRDDGVGMSEEGVRMAVREHTTSKIDRIDDLEAGVATLGFRGEALHAIGAVSRMTVRTKPRAGGRGTELVVEGGEVASVEPTGRPAGTTVVVEDLFYNVPARRKYLKQDATEFSHVNSVVTGYALANPDVSVTLSHDDRETFATTGQGDLRGAVMAVYGRDVASAMLSVDPDESTLPDGPLEGIWGLVSHPETTRASREYLSTFVNGRYVRADAVRDAVLDAYGRQLAGDRYPFAVLFLDLPAGAVDVNVHPRKREVRFAAEAGVREQVRSAVRETLLDEGLVRSSAPRGRSAPDETAVTPERTGGTADSSRPDSPARDTRNDTSGSSIGPRPTAESEPETGAGTSAETDAETGAGTSAETDAETGAGAGPGSGARPGAAAERDPHRKFRDAPAQATLGGGGGDGDGDTEAREFEFDRLPAMRVLGQVHDTYLVAETGDGLVLLDQHAADERVNYERLRERFAGDVTTQALAEPVELELTAGEAELFREHRDALAQLGFRATRVDDRSVRVTTVPAIVAETGGPEIVHELLVEFAAGDPAGTVDAVADDLLADMACYPAITANTSLREGSVVDLLAALDGCENPYACPHGRPVLVEFSEAEIEDRFERDYPGHEGRRT